MQRPETDRRVRPPLDSAELERLALNYVGRYATTRKKLRDYLLRKVQQRGWAKDGPAPIDLIVQKMSDFQYVDDGAFARAKSGSLLRRGYGVQRIKAALNAAGIDEGDAAPTLHVSVEEQISAAISFAQRRKIGPYSTLPFSEEQQRKDLAKMYRAGHSYDVALRIMTPSCKSR